MARQAVAIMPASDAYCQTLGVAHYRMGNWLEAVAALDRSKEIAHTPNGQVEFYLAMSHQQLGDKRQARRYYDMAVTWMADDTPNAGNIFALRDEAAQLLGIEKTPAAAKEQPK